MKLTDKEIHFIDTYLNNSGIVYEDIRFEMTDHVATAMEAMEGDFYENFREYMIVNKASILKADKHFKKTALQRALRSLVGNMLKPLPLLLGVGTGLAAYLFAGTVGNDQAGVALDVAYISLSLLFAVLYLWRYFADKFKYSVADKLCGIVVGGLYWASFLFRPYHFGGSETVFAVFAALFLYTAVMAAVTFRQLITIYRLKLN